MNVVVEHFTHALLMIAAMTQMPMRSVDHSLLQTFTDNLNGCQYMIRGTDEGLNIDIFGGDHCKDRILVDGSRVIRQGE